jgi:hypothetical protein
LAIAFLHRRAFGGKTLGYFLPDCNFYFPSARKYILPQQQALDIIWLSSR